MLCSSVSLASVYVFPVINIIIIIIILLLLLFKDFLLQVCINCISVLCEILKIT